MATFVLIVMLLSLAASLYFTIKSTLVLVPEEHYGIIRIFTKKTKRCVKEGLTWKIPFIQRVQVFPAKLVTYSLYEKDGEAAFVNSEDNLRIIIEGSVQIRPNFNKLYDFAGVTEDSILKGMKDAIEEGLGVIAGQEAAEVFRIKRDTIGLLINCLFRLSRRVDYYLNQNKLDKGMATTAYKSYYNNLLEKIPKEEHLKIEEKLHWDSDWQIYSPDPENADKKIWDVLGFYKQNITKINYMLELESRDDYGQESKVEKIYGIDIAQFTISNVDFTKEYKEALEKQQIEVERMKGVDETHKKKLELQKDYMDSGVSPDESLAEASATVGDSKRSSFKNSGGSTLNINNI
jgi:regulator of protease activity HflC (stomatin/prohibitin superfamily)